MMGVHYLRGLDDERHVPKPLAHHGFPNSSCGEKSGQCRALAADAAIREEEEPRAIAAAQRGSGKLSKTAARARDSRSGREMENYFVHWAQDAGKPPHLGLTRH